MRNTRRGRSPRSDYSFYESSLAKQNLFIWVSSAATRDYAFLEDIVKKLTGRVALAVALAFSSAIVFSGSAFAQYGYDDYYDRGGGQQAHRYGYEKGYHDGYHKGQHEGRENDPGDINVGALQEATHGYRRWMGPIQYFQDGYRDGYRRGFRMGYQSTNRGWRDRDYDDQYGY